MSCFLPQSLCVSCPELSAFVQGSRPHSMCLHTCHHFLSRHLRPFSCFLPFGPSSSFFGTAVVIPSTVLRCCLIYCFSPTLKFKQREDRPVSVTVMFLVPRTVSGPAGELPGTGAWGRVRRAGRWLCHGDFQLLPLDLPSLSQDLRQEDSVIRLHVF